MDQSLEEAMNESMEELLASRKAALQGFFNGTTSLKEATEKLAAASLADDCLSSTWNLIIRIALDSPEHQDKLVDVLVSLSKLPDATTEKGEPLNKYGMQVWRDLPMFRWDIREAWNLQTVPPAPPSRREKAISDFVNLNKFTALLMATEEPLFEFSRYALEAFCTALERPPNTLPIENPLDLYVLAAAAWIEILGTSIYNWDEEHEYRPLSAMPAKGGPLWKGEHSFCRERWNFWGKRFGELASSSINLGDETRAAAREAEIMMQEIYNGEVEE